MLNKCELLNSKLDKIEEDLIQDTKNDNKGNPKEANNTQINNLTSSVRSKQIELDLIYLFKHSTEVPNSFIKLCLSSVSDLIKEKILLILILGRLDHDQSKDNKEWYARLRMVLKEIINGMTVLEYLNCRRASLTENYSEKNLKVSIRRSSLNIIYELYDGYSFRTGGVRLKLYADITMNYLNQLLPECLEDNNENTNLIYKIFKFLSKENNLKLEKNLYNLIKKLSEYDLESIESEFDRLEIRFNIIRLLIDNAIDSSDSRGIFILLSDLIKDTVSKSPRYLKGKTNNYLTGLQETHILGEGKKSVKIDSLINKINDSCMRPTVTTTPVVVSQINETSCASLPSVSNPLMTKESDKVSNPWCGFFTRSVLISALALSAAVATYVKLQ